MAIVANLAAIITADASQMIGATKAASKAAAEMSLNFTKPAQRAGRAMTLGLTVPIGLAGLAANKAAMDFEHSFTNIRTLASGTRRDVEKFNDAILDMAGTIPVGPRELADALYFISSSGFQGAKALDVLKASAQGAVAGLGETKVVADAVTSAVNSYGEANLTAQSAVDTLIATVRAGKAEPTELAATIGQVIPIANALGVEFQEVGGAMAAMTLRGSSTGEAATQLVQVLSAFMRPTDQSRKVLDKMGLSLEGLKTSLSDKGLLPTLQLLKEQFAGNDEALSDFIGRREGLVGFFQLMNAEFSKTEGIMNDVVNSAGAGLSAQEKALQDSQAAWSTFLGAVEAARIEFGQIILKFFEPFIRAATNWFRVFHKLPEPIKTVIVVIGGLLAVIGPLILLLAKLTFIFGQWKVLVFVTRMFGGLTGMIGRFTSALAVARAESAAVAGGLIKSGGAAKGFGFALRASGFAAAAATTAVAGLAIVVATSFVNSLMNAEQWAQKLLVTLESAMGAGGAAVVRTVHNINAELDSMVDQNPLQEFLAKWTPFGGESTIDRVNALTTAIKEARLEADASSGQERKQALARLDYAAATRSVLQAELRLKAARTSSASGTQGFGGFESGANRQAEAENNLAAAQQRRKDALDGLKSAAEGSAKAQKGLNTEINIFGKEIDGSQKKLSLFLGMTKAEFRDWATQAEDGVAGVSAVWSNLGTAFDESALSSARSDLKSWRDEMVSSIGDTASVMSDLAGSTDLAGAREELEDWRDSTTTSLGDVSDVMSELGEKAHLTAAKVMKAFRDRFKDMQRFSKNIQELARRGLTGAMLEEISQGDPAFAAALARMSDRQLRAWMRLREGISSKAGQITGTLEVELNKDEAVRTAGLTADKIVQEFQDKLKDTRAFQSNVRNLMSRGVTGPALQEIIDAGPQFAAAMADSTDAQLRSWIDLRQQVHDVARNMTNDLEAQLGRAAPVEAAKRTGRLTAEAIIKEFRKQFETALDVRKNLRSLLRRGVDPGSQLYKQLRESEPQVVAAVASMNDAQLAEMIKLEGGIRRVQRGITKDHKHALRKRYGDEKEHLAKTVDLYATARDRFRKGVITGQVFGQMARESQMFPANQKAPSFSKLQGQIDKDKEKLKEFQEAAQNRLAKVEQAFQGVGDKGEWLKKQLDKSFRDGAIAVAKKTLNMTEATSTMVGDSTRAMDDFRPAFSDPISDVASRVINPFFQGLEKLSGKFGKKLDVPRISNVRKYHSGGEVGDSGGTPHRGPLRRDEVPAILQKGEVVVPKKLKERGDGPGARDSRFNWGRKNWHKDYNQFLGSLHASRNKGLTDAQVIELKEKLVSKKFTGHYWDHKDTIRGREGEAFQRAVSELTQRQGLKKFTQEAAKMIGWGAKPGGNRFKPEGPRGKNEPWGQSAYANLIKAFAPSRSKGFTDPQVELLKRQTGYDLGGPGRNIFSGSEDKRFQGHMNKQVKKEGNFVKGMLNALLTDKGREAFRDHRRGPNTIRPEHFQGHFPVIWDSMAEKAKHKAKERGDNQMGGPANQTGGLGTREAGPTYRSIIAYLQKTGVPFRAVSTVRPGAITATGNLSYHATGNAVDFAGRQASIDSPALLAINKAFLPVRHLLRELIYSGPGAREIHDGSPYDYSGITHAMHHDHVHVAATRPLTQFARRMAGAGMFDPRLMERFNKLLGTANRRNQNIGGGLAGGLAASGSAELLNRVRDWAKEKMITPDVPKGNGVVGWIREAMGTLIRLGIHLPAWMSQTELVDLAMQESGGNPKAKAYMPVPSGQVARGLMQTIPSTFEAYNVKGYERILNPVHNAMAAIRYIAANYNHVPDAPYVKGGPLHEPVVGIGAMTGKSYTFNERGGEGVGPMYGARAPRDTRGAAVSLKGMTIQGTVKVIDSKGNGRFRGIVIDEIEDQAAFRARRAGVYS